MTPDRSGLINHPKAPSQRAADTDGFDFTDEPPAGTPPGAADDLPGLIAFDDLFSQDADLKERIDRIVERVEANDHTTAAEFTAEADADQRKFIDCPADTIRLLAPAGSGKTQSIVNRVLTRVAGGAPIDRFLILTFDNAASLSLREKMEAGLAGSGLRTRGAPSVLTLNRFGYQLLRGVLRDRIGRCDLGERPEGDRQESVRRALEKLKADRPDVYQLVGSLEDAISNSLPLGEFVDIAGRFKGDVRQFHEMLTGLLGKVEGGLYHLEEGDAVNLLTYFRAKGRQWNTVIIPGANQKVIPLGTAHVEDERRLFYVAVTRATSNLIVSFVRHAVRSKVEPSQFIDEMGLKDAEEKRAKVLS